MANIGTAEISSGYGLLIEEVFIKPIRTVMVVDDEFPTLEALLEEGGEDQAADQQKQRWNRIDLKRARNIIEFCRAPHRRWMVELHDGSCEINPSVRIFIIPI